MPVAVGFQPVAKWWAIPRLAELPCYVGRDAGATVLRSTVFDFVPESLTHRDCPQAPLAISLSCQQILFRCFAGLERIQDLIHRFFASNPAVPVSLWVDDHNRPFFAEVQATRG